MRPGAAAAGLAVAVSSTPVRRGAVVWLTAVALAAAAVALAIAFFIPWLPDTASEESERIAFVFWFTTIICIAIFALVAAVSIYAGLKFRARPEDPDDGAPIHGHTGIEIVWTAVPALLVTVIAIASTVALVQNERVGDNPLRIDVTAQQFAWSFKYPNGAVTSTLRLPLGRDVVLRLTAKDVIHSFWVPEFGQKMDAVPGIFTTLVITPKRVGQYPLPCTELCGVGHAVMRSAAIVMEPGAYDAWIAKQGRGQEPREGQAGAALFEEHGCGSCHTFTPAGSKATIGPNLDNVAEFARSRGEDPEDYVRESIVDPGAYKHPGFTAEIPDAFGSLTETQLDDLVQYLLEGNKTSK